MVQNWNCSLTHCPPPYLLIAPVHSLTCLRTSQRWPHSQPVSLRHQRPSLTFRWYRNLQPSKTFSIYNSASTILGKLHSASDFLFSRFTLHRKDSSIWSLLALLCVSRYRRKDAGDSWIGSFDVVVLYHRPSERSLAQRRRRDCFFLSLFLQRDGLLSFLPVCFWIVCVTTI